MARLRDNGNGARTTLREEGYLIPGGDYEAHRSVARQLGVPCQNPGGRQPTGGACRSASPWTVELDGRRWRLAREDEPVRAGPSCPTPEAEERSAPTAHHLDRTTMTADDRSRQS